MVLWLLLSFPQAAGRAQKPESKYSIAGRIASGLEVVVRPIGFNHDIALALIPAMAAREVAVAALATVYAIDDADDEAAGATALSERLRGALDAADRARLPRLVRVRAAVHLDHRRRPGARPTAGNGRCFMVGLPVRRWPISRRALPTGLAIALGL